MKIRKATKKDIEEISKLLYEYTEYEHKLDKNVKAESLSKIKKEELEHFKLGTIYFIIEEESRVIGCINISIDKRGKGKIGVIHNLIITENERGKGYGDKLVKYTLNYLKKHGCSRARTFVYLNNKKSKDFWTKRGFDLELGYSGSVKLK